MEILGKYLSDSSSGTSDAFSCAECFGDSSKKELKLWSASSGTKSSTLATLLSDTFEISWATVMSKTLSKHDTNLEKSSTTENK